MKTELSEDHANLSKLLCKFWKTDSPVFPSEKPLSNHESVFWAYRALAYAPALVASDSFNVLHAALHSFDPIPCTDDARLIAIYPDASKREKGIRQNIKPGRFFRMIAPRLPDSRIESMVKEWLYEYGPCHFTLQSGKTRADFKRAYTGEIARMQNPETTCGRGSLANSCMHGDVSPYGVHPAEAYASGDFLILFAKNQESEICARTVVMIAKRGESVESPEHGPIYGTSDKAIDYLQQALNDIRAIPADSWEGATLLKIGTGAGYCAPYLDVYPTDLDDMGGAFDIVPNGDYETTGLPDSQFILCDSNSLQCSDCGRRIDVDDAYPCPSYDGTYYCESCYHERFTSCDYCGEYVDRDDIKEVLYISRFGNQDSGHICNDCLNREMRNGEILETDSGEYWKADNVRITRDGEIISEIEFQRNYFICDWSEEICHCDEMAEIVDGSQVDIVLVESDSRYQLNDSGLWENLQLALDI